MFTFKERPALVEMNDVKHHHIHRVKNIDENNGDKAVVVMDSLNLEPRYSTNEIPGKCLKCLAENELNNCLLKILKGDGEETELESQFELLSSFLKSPTSKKLIDESERLLSEGKQVVLNITLDTETGMPKYELKIIS